MKISTHKEAFNKCFFLLQCNHYFFQQPTEGKFNCQILFTFCLFLSIITVCLSFTQIFRKLSDQLVPQRVCELLCPFTSKNWRLACKIAGLPSCLPLEALVALRRNSGRPGWCRPPCGNNHQASRITCKELPQKVVSPALEFSQFPPSCSPARPLARSPPP